MKPFLRPLALACALLLSVPTLAQTPVPASPARPVELFDGQSLAGWIAVPAATNGAPAWIVTNGVIRAVGRPNGYLRTSAAYRDYDLHAEWRWPEGGGNSGLFVHLNGPDVVWPLCFEAQLQSGNAGELRLNGGAAITGLANPAARSLPRRAPALEKPPGEWNSCHLTCRGDSITIRINGVLQNETAGISVNSGAIALQAEGRVVEFRNLTVQPLAPK